MKMFISVVNDYLRNNNYIMSKSFQQIDTFVRTRNGFKVTGSEGFVAIDKSKGGAVKLLLYAHHGYGKTFQCRYFQKRYGKGII